MYFTYIQRIDWYICCIIFHYVSPSGTWYEHNKCELIKTIIGKFLNQDYASYSIMIYRLPLNSGAPFYLPH